jgi:hypothetical protein
MAAYSSRLEHGLQLFQFVAILAEDCSPPPLEQLLYMFRPSKAARIYHATAR